MTHTPNKKKHIPYSMGNVAAAVVSLKRCEDEIAKWKVRRPSYVLGKELAKIHMQDFPHAATWEEGQWSKASSRGSYT